MSKRMMKEMVQRCLGGLQNIGANGVVGVLKHGDQIRFFSAPIEEFNGATVSAALVKAGQQLGRVVNEEAAMRAAAKTGKG
jgi:hypothetical protein